MAPAARSEPSQLRLKALAAALAGRGVCILHQTSDHRFDMAEHLPDIWPAARVLSKTEADFMSGPLAEQFSAAVDRCLQLQELQSLEFELANGVSTLFYHAKIVPDEGGALAILNDVTEERSRNAAMQSLLREVSHRSKNLLAIVQSVAMQTAHHSDGIEDFLRKFRGRLHALSSTQDLVTESDWRGTQLHALVASQLVRVGQEAVRRVHVTGADPLLGPNASLHLGLAIHELATNATVHGALRDGGSGSVWVHAAIAAQADELDRHLVIEWMESGIPQTPALRQPRFGTLVLERIVPLSVSGTAQYAIDDGQVTYRLNIPAGQFDS